jgi:hypothetical protein
LIDGNIRQDRFSLDDLFGSAGNTGIHKSDPEPPEDNSPPTMNQPLYGLELARANT